MEFRLKSWLSLVTSSLHNNDAILLRIMWYDNKVANKIGRMRDLGGGKICFFENALLVESCECARRFMVYALRGLFIIKKGKFGTF